MIRFRGQRTSTVFALIMFCAFAASLLAVLMLGANAYKSITEMSRKGYDERACLSYVWTKVKNGDEAGYVKVGDFCGLSSLYIYEDYDGVMYQTVIYAYDRRLYELFCETGIDLSPEDGTPILKTESIRFEQLENGLIKVEDSYGSLFIYLRCDKGAAEGGLPG